MESLTAYRAQGKLNGLTFLFKYDLNGDLRAFEIPDGILDDNQKKWLYSERFPANEHLMLTNWVNNPKAKKIFVITIAPADISFETFWNIYDVKKKKDLTEKAWNKLTEAEKIKCFTSHKDYVKDLAKTGQGKAHLVTWLNQKRYNDEY